MVNKVTFVSFRGGDRPMDPSLTGGIFPPKMHLLRFWWYASDWIQKIFEALTPSAKDAQGILFGS